MKLRLLPLELLLWSVGMWQVPQAALASADVGPPLLRHALTLSLSPDAPLRSLAAQQPPPGRVSEAIDPDLVAAVNAAFGLGDEPTATPSRATDEAPSSEEEARLEADRQAIALALVSIAEPAEAGTTPPQASPLAPPPDPLAPRAEPVAIELRPPRSQEPSPDEHTSLLQFDADTAEPAAAWHADAEPPADTSTRGDAEPSVAAVLADLAEVLNRGRVDEVREAGGEPPVIAPQAQGEPPVIAPQAQGASASPSPFGAQHGVAVAADRLAGVRGGFQTAAGVQIAFGIERAVYINGNLVTTTSLNVSTAGQVSTGTGAGSSLPLAGAGSLGVVQVGAGNALVTSTLGNAAALGAVVQNTLNGQAIQSRTVIEATTNSLQVLRSSGLQSSLRGAVIDSLRR